MVNPDTLHPLLEAHLELGIWRLASLPSGDCKYVGPDGCTVHPIRPPECRAYDCRDHVRRGAPPLIQQAAKALQARIDAREANSA